MNDSDVSEVKKVILTYDEYAILKENYLNKIKDSVQREVEKRSEKINGFNNYSSKMDGMFRYINKTLFWFHYSRNNNKLPKVKYLDYSYRIQTNIDLFSKKAQIIIYGERDTNWVQLGYIDCYKIHNGWKLSGIEGEPQGFFSEYSHTMRPQYTDWFMNYSKLKIENFPYDLPRNLWTVICDGDDQNNSVLLTEKEFKKIYLDYYPWEKYKPETDRIKADDLYTGYLSSTKSFLRNVHDSLVAHNMILNFKEEFVRKQEIVNAADNSGSDWVNNFRISFYFEVPLNSEGKTEKFGFGFASFIPTSNAKGFKLFLGLTEFYRNVSNTADYGPLNFYYQD